MPTAHYIHQINLLLEFFLIVGVVACSISGALRAIDSRMDITGALLLAFILSNAGGTFRDVILNTEVFWIKDHLYIWLSISTGALTFIVASFNSGLLAHRQLNRLLIFTDAIGLGVFCLAGVEKSFLMGQGPLIAIIMGVWTSVGGGIITDVIANRIPLVFSSELYITVSLLGAVLYILLSIIMIHVVAAFIAIVFMIVLRMLSIKYHWKLPLINT